jgi:hypothetical protein
MTESTTLGADLRRERERRGLALKSISENTKLSIALLEGLEADDISRWPGGIFRRAFVRTYAQCVGLDPDMVMRRFEEQFPADGVNGVEHGGNHGMPGRSGVMHPLSYRGGAHAASIATTPAMASSHARLLGTAADLTVAMILAFGSAAAGSRLLWPVLLIACYYAAGVLLTGTSPMVALLAEGFAPRKPKPVPAPAPAPVPEPVAAAAQPVVAVQAPIVDPMPAPMPEPALLRAAAPATVQRPAPRHAARRGSDRQVRQRRASQAQV